MRQGRLAGRDLFRTLGFGTEEETVLDFLTTYYTTDRPPPPRVFLRKARGRAPREEYSARSSNPPRKILPPGDPPP
jgi:excinuclease UvrABC nuclease subunit